MAEAVVDAAATLDVDVKVAAPDDTEDPDAVTVDEISDDPEVVVVGIEEKVEVQFNGMESGKSIERLPEQDHPQRSGVVLADELEDAAAVDEPESVDVMLAGILIG